MASCFANCRAGHGLATPDVESHDFEFPCKIFLSSHIIEIQVYERQHELVYSLRLSVDDLRKTPMKQDECFDLQYVLVHLIFLSKHSPSIIYRPNSLIEALLVRNGNGSPLMNNFALPYIMMIVM